MPDEIGPASLTSPLLKLANGSLAMSIETNKEYLDSSPWMQRAVLFHSTDQGLSWSGPIMAAQDPTGRIFNWDMRCGVAPDGRIATFTWTYDSHAAAYINIHRRISSDHGTSWSEPEDLGFADQAARPAFLVDGTLVLAYVDRFQSHSIRARRAPALDAPFDPASDTVIYAQGGGAEREGSTGDLLTEMSVWNFGLPYAEALPDGDVMVVYYAGTQSALDIHWARLRL